MNWGDRRRLIVVSGFSLVALVIALATAFAFIYKPPSCTDGTQNQNEEGVDCGGSCTYLCSASVAQPTVTFARPTSPQQGRTDVVAYIVNPNARAAVKNAEYTIEVYDADNIAIGKQVGTVDLPPASVVPVFVPNFASGFKTAAHTFLTFDQSSLKWFTYTGTRIIPKAGNSVIENTNTPRVRTTLTNPSAHALYNVHVVATVFDANGNAIAASETVLGELPPQGTAPAIFTWNTPFPQTPARVDILPVIPLDTTP
jgi:hypothetical protein